MLLFSWWLQGVTALRGLVVDCLIAVHYSLAPFASKQVPAVHLSPVFASLESILTTRRDADGASTAS